MDSENTFVFIAIIIICLAVIAFLLWRIEKKNSEIELKTEMLMTMCSLLITQNAAAGDPIKKLMKDRKIDDSEFAVSLDDSNHFMIVGDEKYEKLFAYLMGEDLGSTDKSTTPPKRP